MNDNRTMPAFVRMLIVDDHGLLAEGLAGAVSELGVDTFVVSPPVPEEILALAAEQRPALVVLDLDLGSPVGRSTPLIAPLVSEGASVVMLTGVTDNVPLAECLEAGASGVISKSVGFAELLAIIERLLAGDSSMFERQRQELASELRRHRAEQLDKTAALRTLTPREREVLAGLSDGRSAQELASAMFVSLATVRSQIRSILRKFGVSSQLAAVAEARRAGLDAA